MIVRIFIAGFASLVGGVSYLSGLSRLMNGLLLGFGALMAFFLGTLFILPSGEDILGFPVQAMASGIPFYVLMVLFVGLALVLLLKPPKPGKREALSGRHAKFLAGGLAGCLASVFLPVIFWFPSNVRRMSVDETVLGYQVLAGVCFFLLILSAALYLLYRSTRGQTEGQRDFMQRIVLAIFAVLQLDKIPAFIAYLLVYSPDTQVIFPGLAAVALAGYLPVGLFLWFSAD